MNEQLKIIISAEVDKLKQGVENAKKSVKSFKEQVKEASANVDDNMASMGSAISGGLKVATGAIAAAGAGLVALGASSAEYRAEQAKLNAAFESAGANAKTAYNTYYDLNRVLGDSGQATEAAAHLAKLTTEEQALSEWTNICQGVYATFGDSLPIEGLTEAANETAKVGQVTGGLADALNWAGISEDEFNEKLEKCNSEAEREKLIRETLNKTYSEAAAVYEETAKDTLAQNEAQANLADTIGYLGETLAPVITAFTNFANQALDAVLVYIIPLTEKYMPLLQSVLDSVVYGLEAALGWASQHKEILAVMGGIIMTVVTAIGLYNAVAAVKAAMAAAEVTTVWALVSAYAAQAVAVMAALAPYVAIVAAIAAVIAIIVLCVKHWDEIKEAVAKVVKAIVDKAKELKEKVVNYFTEMGSNIVNKVNDIKEKAVEKFNSLKSAAVNVASNLVSSIGDKFGAIKDKIKEKIDAAKEAVSNSIKKMKELFNFSWSLPKPKFPKFKVSGGEAPWGFMGKGSLPKISISWNKLGGVFDMPTLFNYGGSLQGIGEDGAEAVVPLEKNTKWLDRLATMLNEKQGNKNIVLQVDGKTFAQISVDSINALTKQTGSLPLRLA